MSLLSTFILLIVLLFFIYRLLLSINESHKEDLPLGDVDRRSRRFRDEIFKSEKVETSVKSKKIRIPEQVDLEQINESGEDLFAELKSAEELEDLFAFQPNFKKVGDFKIANLDGYIIRAYTNVESSLIAILYKDNQDREWVNFISEYEDGRVVTTSSADSSMLAKDRPKGMPLFCYPNLKIEHVLRRHKLEIRLAQLKPSLVGIDQFKEFFKSNYIRLQRHFVEKEKEKENLRLSDSPLDIDGIYKEIKAQLEDPLDTKQKATATESFKAPSREDLDKWFELIKRKINLSKNKENQFEAGLVWITETAASSTIVDLVKSYLDLSFRNVEKDIWLVSNDKGYEDLVDLEGLRGSKLFDKLNSVLPENEKFFKVPFSVEGISFYSRIPINS